ncbi:hypothetical protein [Nonomuraea sp. CA-141351]|uniref:hypothetical protein n=1 Tax=Nonomuraea sp. CA-141351 TaxID=3239996 RepID=UPI003D8BE63A
MTLAKYELIDSEKACHPIVKMCAFVTHPRPVVVGEGEFSLVSLATSTWQNADN